MSDDLGRAVGEAQATAERAMERANEVGRNVHAVANQAATALGAVRDAHHELDRRLNRLEWDGTRLAERMDEQEQAMAKLQAANERTIEKFEAAAEKLIGSAEVLAARVQQPAAPPHEQIRTSWQGAKLRTKAKLIGALVAILSAPKVVEAAVTAIEKLLAHVH
jgi:DNA repair ATPase RecN